MKKIQMVDLHGQYLRLKDEIDAAIRGVLESSHFIQGPDVKRFSGHLAAYVNGSSVVTCGNGTDALQIAAMALELKPGAEVIIPAFTYVATAEVIGLLGLTPVLVDVDERTFNIDVSQIEQATNSRTRAVVPVHLFGQCANMASLIKIAHDLKITVIEDAAQSLGATCNLADHSRRQAGTIGKIGVTSFFPTKPLGCFGDGGAIFTDDAALSEKMQMIANHGQRVKYSHELIGVNSRLDTLQAAILDVKLKHMDDFTQTRQDVAARFDDGLAGIKELILPYREENSSHIFHQYTLQAVDRDGLKEHLAKLGIPSMVYYPTPLHFQRAYQQYGKGPGSFPVAERLSKNVISLPIHTEMETDQLDYICDAVRKFYNA